MAHGPTTDRDITLVRRMVESHICDPRTIILAVLPANVDFATQEILTLAKKYDPDGERTLGVLTKPDLVTESSGKQVVCNLVLGKRMPLRLGYYLVCNRGPDDDGRRPDERELMFSEAPWNALPRDRLGRDALKMTLSALLAGLTKSVFGALRQEIQRELEKAQRQLDAMGSPRETENQQRIFLSSIAGKFQELVGAARLGHYSQNDAFEDDAELRLCTSIVNLADDFVQGFADMGHAYRFEAEEEMPRAGVKVEHVPMEVVIDPAPRLELYSEDVSERSSPVSVTMSPTPVAAPFDDDISDLLYDLPDYGSPKSGIQDWIADLHKRYRGPELTSPGPAILGSAFKAQSVRWDSIARYLVSDCIRAVHAFIRHALSLLCPSSNLANGLWDSISDKVISRYKASLEQAAYLTRIERCLSPYTLNQLFSAEVVRTRSTRLCNKLKDNSSPYGHHEGGTMAISINALHHLAEHEANASHANHEIHDALKAYYKIAAKRFQDNLYMQAVSHGLVSGEETPLGVFSQEWVIGLGADKLDELVGDSESARGLRREVEGWKGDLEKAMAILRG
ncbi:dynamin family protein [Candidatus Bathyarchaeota archaeon]|nr:dynamin family protein [Candidatus Bathyarchaeota archaeon]